MLLNNDVKYSYILRKFIVVSLCEVFKDIVPSYKIRTWTEKENQQKVNKLFTHTNLIINLTK